MEALAFSTVISSSSPQKHQPSAGNFHRRRHDMRSRRVAVSALKRDDYGWGYGGELVDENMIVLRMRIREMKMTEKISDEPAPSDWMEWEKKCYSCYDSSVCKVVGLLQTFLMNTRPSVGIGMLALLLLSVPTSVVSMLIYMMQTLRWMI